MRLIASILILFLWVGLSAQTSVLSDGNTAVWIISDEEYLTLDNDSIDSWEDQSGNDNHLTPVSDATRPVFNSTHGTVQFNGVDAILRTSNVDFNDTVSLYIVMNYIKGSTNGTVFSSGYTANSGLLNVNALSLVSQIYSGAWGPSISNTPKLERFIMTVQFNGASSIITFDGETDQVGDAGTNSLAGVVLGGRSNGTGYYSYMDMEVEEFILRTVIDDSDNRDSIYDYLEDKYKYGDTKIAGVGNSIMVSPYTAVGMNEKYTMYNNAVIGNTIDQQRVIWQNATYDKTTLDYVFIQLGVNDVINGIDTATIRADYDQLLDTIADDISESCKIIAFTMTPAKGYSGLTDTENDRLLALNEWLKTVPNHVDVLSTVNWDDLVGVGDSMNTDYTIDHLHPYVAPGEQIIVDNIEGILSSFEGSVYYVKNGGSDSNTGLSDSQAWETIGKVEDFDFDPGDSILFNKGDTWTRTGDDVYMITLDNNNHSGTSDNNVVFGNYGTGELPTFTGYHKYEGWVNYSGNIWYTVNAYRQYSLVMFDSVNWATDRVDTITDLDANYEYFDKYVWPDGGSDDTLFVYLDDVTDTVSIIGSGIKDMLRGYGVSHITIDGLHFTYADYTPIVFTDTCLDITIKNCILNWSGANGMFIGHTDTFAIHDNLITDMGGDGTYVTFCNTPGYGGHGEMYNNTYTDVGQGGGVGSDRQVAGFWWVSDVNFYDNTIHHTGEGSIIEASNSYGSIAQRNMNFYDNDITIDIETGSIFNVFAGVFNIYGNKVKATSETNNIYFTYMREYDSTWTQVTAYNNTVSGVASVSYFTNDAFTIDSSYATFKNNIFNDIKSYWYHLGNVGDGYWLDKIDIDYNLYSNSDGDWAYYGSPGDGNYTYDGWKTLTSQDGNSLIGDPLFAETTNYTLSSSSPAINAGITDANTARLGITYNGSMDIGYWQSSYEARTEKPLTGTGSKVMISNGVILHNNE